MFLRKVSQDLAEAFQWAAVPSARSSPLSASCWHVPSKEKSKCKSVGGEKKKKYLKHGARVDLPQMFPSGRMPWWAAHCPGHFEGQEGARAGCLPSPPHGPPTMAAHHQPTLTSSWLSRHGSPPPPLPQRSPGLRAPILPGQRAQSGWAGHLHGLYFSYTYYFLSIKLI